MLCEISINLFHIVCYHFNCCLSILRVEWILQIVFYHFSFAYGSILQSLENMPNSIAFSKQSWHPHTLARFSFACLISGHNPNSAALCLFRFFLSMLFPCQCLFRHTYALKNVPLKVHLILIFSCFIARTYEPPEIHRRGKCRCFFSLSNFAIFGFIIIREIKS